MKCGRFINSNFLLLVWFSRVWKMPMTHKANCNQYEWLNFLFTPSPSRKECVRYNGSIWNLSHFLDRLLTCVFGNGSNHTVNQTASTSTISIYSETAFFGQSKNNRMLKTHTTIVFFVSWQLWGIYSWKSENPEIRFIYRIINIISIF